MLPEPPSLPLLRAESRLADFDPLTLTMHFDQEVVDLPSLQNRIPPGTRTSLLPNATESPWAATLYADVLAHECSHLVQIASTASGMQSFLNRHMEMKFKADLIHHASSAGRGTVRVGVLRNPELYSRSDEFHSCAVTLAWLANYDALSFGGITRPTSTVREWAGPDSGNGPVATCHGRHLGNPNIEEVHFIALPIDVPRDELRRDSVSLGAVHLFEGIGAAVQSIQLSFARLRSATSRNDHEDAIDLLNMDFLAENPYRIAMAFYTTYIDKHHSIDVLQRLYEPLIIMDVALNMSITGPVSVDNNQPQPSDELEPFTIFDPTNEFSLPFNNYILLLERLSQCWPDAHLRGASKGEIETFQNNLLRLAGAPYSSIVNVQERLLQAVGPVVDLVAEFGFWPRHAIEEWRNAFNFHILSRIEGSSACPHIDLAHADVESLEIFSRFQMARSWGTQGEESMFSGDRTPFLFQSLLHASSVLDEITFGSRPCARRSSCQLASRPACLGITGEFKPRGNRCPREHIIAHLMDNFGIVRFS